MAEEYSIVPKGSALIIGVMEHLRRSGWMMASVFSGLPWIRQVRSVVVEEARPVEEVPDVIPAEYAPVREQVFYLPIPWARHRVWFSKTPDFWFNFGEIKQKKIENGTWETTRLPFPDRSK